MKTFEKILSRVGLPYVYFALSEMRSMPTGFSHDQKIFFLSIIDWINQSCYQEDTIWDGRPASMDIDSMSLGAEDARQVLMHVESWCLGEGIVIYGGLTEPGKWRLSVVAQSPETVTLKRHFGEPTPRATQLELIPIAAAA